MEKKFAQRAYRSFVFWGVCSALGITICTSVDAVLVGNFIGSEGLAVVNIATPIFLLYSLFGITLGVGANIQIGKKLGGSKIEEANQLFNAQIFVGLGIGLLCVLISVLFGDVLLEFLGAKGDLLPLAKEYLTVVFFSAPVFIVYHMLAVSIRTDGDPKLAAFSSSIVIITNICLDVLFLKVLGWGIVGASASLCIAEALGVAVLMLHFRRKHALLKFSFILPRFADVKRFVTNGFGVGSIFIFQAIIMLCFNALLISGGTEEGVIHVAVFGIFYTMSMIPCAVFDGSGSAIFSIVSIFAGEKNVKGILTVLRQSMKIVICAGVIITAFFLVYSKGILWLFGLPSEVVLSAVPAFRIFAVSMVFTGVNTLITAFWQVIGRSRLAAVFSVTRNLISMLVFGFTFISQYDIIGLSITYVCSEALCFVGVLSIEAFKNSKAYVKKKYAFSSAIYEKYYIVQTQSVAQISSDLEQLCEDWKIGIKQAFFINLIVEELLLNIIKFGLNDPAQKCYIAIKVMDNDGEYIIRIRDNVKTYNPFESSGDEIDNAVIKLITQKTQYYEYQRKLIFNYLYLIV